jgi:hypothetical protein
LHGGGRPLKLLLEAVDVAPGEGSSQGGFAGISNVGAGGIAQGGSAQGSFGPGYFVQDGLAHGSFGPQAFAHEGYKQGNFAQNGFGVGVMATWGVEQTAFTQRAIVAGVPGLITLAGSAIQQGDISWASVAQSSLGAGNSVPGGCPPGEIVQVAPT